VTAKDEIGIAPLVVLCNLRVPKIIGFHIRIQSLLQAKMIDVIV